MNLVGTIILEVLLFVIVMALAFAIIIIYSEHCHDEGRKPGILSITISILSISAIVTGFSLWAVFTANDYHSSYEKLNYEIYSLDSGTSVEGNFVLGSGSIESHITYYFYIKTERGFELQKITTEEMAIYLVETNQKKPSIVEKKEKDSFEKYRVIYVPEGTIVKSFTG